METNERARRLIDQLYSNLGFLYDWHVCMAHLDPAFIEAHLNFGDIIHQRKGALPGMYRELIFTVVLVPHRQGKVAENHIRKALDMGATPQHVIEALQVAWTPTGSLTFVHGMKALVNVLRERGLYQRPELPYEITDADW